MVLSSVFQPRHLHRKVRESEPTVLSHHRKRRLQDPKLNLGELVLRPLSDTNDPNIEHLPCSRFSIPCYQPDKSVDQESSIVYQQGFHVGLKVKYVGSKDERHFIHNHLAFTVKFHEDPPPRSPRKVNVEHIEIPTRKPPC
ncbi:hypothetical protein U1Q18_011690 [Sarracenia purpurea var. burkii]